ncbi:hypothetical protein [Actinomadura fibrosa]|uniref:WXG100 family type VII secretion target n=1 Tax=Actinomadura fibrosa TaxID=111802 RepID=A0ABW2XHC6_9ACTN|nr:hypothetical protein [Actinomadura fibrosa]
MSTSDDVRIALARLTTDERRTLVARWTGNAVQWDATSPRLGAMWTALAALVAEVEELEQARTAAMVHSDQVRGHTMRAAGKRRR